MVNCQQQPETKARFLQNSGRIQPDLHHRLLEVLQFEQVVGRAARRPYCSSSFWKWSHSHVESYDGIIVSIPLHSLFQPPAGGAFPQS
jgi:hypothetical protein